MSERRYVYLWKGEAIDQMGEEELRRTLADMDSYEAWLEQELRRYPPLFQGPYVMRIFDTATARFYAQTRLDALVKERLSGICM